MANFIAQNTIEDEPLAAYVGLIADASPIRVKSGVSSGLKVASIAVVAASATEYTVTINGTPFAITSGAGATTAAITAALVTAINAGDEPVTASGADTPLIIKSDEFGPEGDFALVVGANLTSTVTSPQGGSLPFGKFVSMDSGNTYDRAVKLPTVAADVTSGRGLGIVCADNYTRASDTSTPEAVPGFSMANILEVGRIWVEVEEPVLKGDDVFARYSEGGLGLGSLRKSAGGGAAAVPRASFDGDSRTIGGKLLAIVKLNR